VDERNGCVWVIPESHKRGLLPHKASGASWYITVPADSAGIPVRMKAGEAVAFSGFMLHRSLANRTPRPRRAFFMEYSDSPDDSEKTMGLHPEPLWMARGQLNYPVARGNEK
ncbi:MAG TPA: phytanoyl-CoA dioxygenase family protein, partial [Tepidisphaeraceae bacterium]